MITPKELRRNARSKLRDAEALFAGRRYDAAVYLCGYAVELALKARICVTLKWEGYPSTRKEFEGYQSFKVHTLELLLHLSGREQVIRSTRPTEWSIVSGWDPESRYATPGMMKRGRARDVIAATRVVLEGL